VNDFAEIDAEAIGHAPITAVASVAQRLRGGGDPAHRIELSIIEAMARRAAAHEGATRQWLAQRIAARLDVLLAPGVPASGGDDSAHAAPQRALAGLSALTDRLGRAAAPAAQPGAHSGQPLRPFNSAPPSVIGGAVDAFSATWTRLRADQRLRAALAQVPAQPGPLNSAQLVSRALQAMRDASPDYLYAFMAHIDGLLALEPPAENRRR